MRPMVASPPSTVFFSNSRVLLPSRAAESAAGNLASLPLMTKGLLTTVIGLLGVFLVLGLFFLTIKLMQHIKTKDEK